MFSHTKYNAQHELHEEAEQCYICDVKFRKWGISGRHQCRLCLKAICVKCSRADILGGQKIKRCILACTKHYLPNQFFQQELSLLFNEKHLLPILHAYYTPLPPQAYPVQVVVRLLSGPIASDLQLGVVVPTPIHISFDPDNGRVSLVCRNMKEQEKLMLVLRAYFNIQRYELIHLERIDIQWNVMQQMRVIYDRLHGREAPCDYTCYEHTRSLAAPHCLFWMDFYKGDALGHKRGTTFYCLEHYRFFCFVEYIPYSPPSGQSGRIGGPC
jgi:hypothetical protein